MFGIVLVEYKIGDSYPSKWKKKCEELGNQFHSGWVKRVNPRRDVVPMDELRFIPVLGDSTQIEGIKKWKTKEAAIKFADTLSKRLEIIVSRSIVTNGTAPFQKVLPFDIYVYDLDTMRRVYAIDNHCIDTYDSTLSR